MAVWDLGYVFADSDEEVLSIGSPAASELSDGKPTASAKRRRTSTGSTETAALLSPLDSTKVSPKTRRRWSSALPGPLRMAATASGPLAHCSGGSSSSSCGAPPSNNNSNSNNSNSNSNNNNNSSSSGGAPPRGGEAQPAASESAAAQEETPVHEGYTLRDLRRIVSAMLPRYGQLLSAEERSALEAFSQLPLRAQQLYARFLCRKWPQWVPLDGLGARYRELGLDSAKAAVADLCDGGAQATAQKEEVVDVADDNDNNSNNSNNSNASPGPWLLDTASESVASLLARPLDDRNVTSENYGTLLLGALPVVEIRRLARGLGVSEAGSSGGKRGAKGRLLARVW
ncbi:unnamed protein product, partial [Polarella glacialis]